MAQHVPASLRGAIDLSALTQPNRPAGTVPTGAGPATSPHPAAAPPSLVIEGTDANFQAILELSTKVPVLVELYAGSPTASLATLINELGGQFVLATVNVAANPQLTAAFQSATTPTVAAVIAGRPVSLYEGELPVEQVREVLEQLTELAAQNGVSGKIDVGSSDAVAGDATGDDAEEQLPPLHQEAFDAISTGDHEAAMSAYRKALAQNPRDAFATAGLAQVSLLARVRDLQAQIVRARAADAPSDVSAALDVADLDMAGGHIEDALTRLLELFPALDPAARDRVRVRLLEYFELVGADDERVVAARRALTSLLY